ncbi:MAG: DNA polymerase Y family protein [Gemmatimonadota bacterium]
MLPPPSSRASSLTSVCLWLPTFELRLELVRTPELDATSVALLAPGSSGGRGEIRQLSERAAEAGARAGMRVSQAISLCPSLTLLEPDPAHYQAATQGILEILEGVSPVVESTEPGVFHVGVDGLERLYGPPRVQMDRILYALLEVLPRPLVAAIRMGRAPGCFGARVAAAAARTGAPVLVEEGSLASFLAPSPISVLPVPEEMLERLKRLDVRTLGELGELPLSALLRHFGPPGREARELARGERLDPVRPVHRPRPIRVSLDFPAPVGDREALHRGVDRLLERGLARPERKDRSVRGIRAGGILEGGGSWEVSATLREPAAKREALAFPLRQRILLSPPPRAVETLFVEFFDFGTPVLQRDLFRRQEEGGRATRDSPLTAGGISQTLREAVRELTLKLGHSPLYRVVEVDPWSRIPERRHALLEIEP